MCIVRPEYKQQVLNGKHKLHYQKILAAGHTMLAFYQCGESQRESCTMYCFEWSMWKLIGDRNIDLQMSKMDIFHGVNRCKFCGWVCKL